MQKSKYRISQLILAQITAIVIWYIITVVQWINNPKGSPDISIPLVVRGIEAFSIFIVAGIITLAIQKTKRVFKLYISRLLLIIFLYIPAILSNILSLKIRQVIGYTPPKIDGFFFIQSLHFYIPLLLAFVVYALVKNRIDLQNEKEEKLKAESLAQQAKWMMLRYQVNPHFLFNALNSIRALIGSDNENARKIVTELSEYFRYSLSVNNKDLLTVKEEINAVQNYLEIQKIRFQEKLQIDMSADKDTFNNKIPIFAIQTLVENAVKYGLKTHEGTITITIKTFIENNKMNIVVKNSGKLMPVNNIFANENGTNTGLKNLKQRLQFLDNEYCFELYEKDGTVIAHIIMKNIQESE